MYWFIILAAISILLILTGSVSLVVKLRRFRWRSEQKQTKSMVEMMKVAEKAGREKQHQAPDIRH